MRGSTQMHIVWAPQNRGSITLTTYESNYIDKIIKLYITKEINIFNSLTNTHTRSGAWESGSCSSTKEGLKPEPFGT